MKQGKRGRTNANDEVERNRCDIQTQGKERPLLTEGKCASAEVPLCLGQCPGHRKDSCLLRQQTPKCFSNPKFTTARNIWQMAIYSLS